MREIDNGKSVTVKVSDRCTGCAERDLDFVSPDMVLLFAS
jgi:rare lipoprotein A (peptidoglycan hydrolase)